MDIGELKIIKAVADAGSFSGAAAELNYVQSHISTRVSLLEQEIGAPIFERHRRGVTFTQKGEQFLKYANDMTRILEEANRLMSENDIPGGTLRIVSMQTSAQTILPPLLSQYHKRFPDVRLEIRTGTSARNIRSVLDHDADLAFAAEKVRQKELSCHVVSEEELVLLTSERTPKEMTAAELSSRTLLVFPKGCAYRAMLERYLAASRIALPDVIEFDSLPAILAAACSGLGVTLLPLAVAKSYIRDRYLYAHRIPDQYSRLPLCLIHRKEGYRPSALTQMLKLCREIR